LSAWRASARSSSFATCHPLWRWRTRTSVREHRARVAYASAICSPRCDDLRGSPTKTLAAATAVRPHPLSSSSKHFRRVTLAPPSYTIFGIASPSVKRVRVHKLGSTVGRTERACLTATPGSACIVVDDQAVCAEQTKSVSVSTDPTHRSVSEASSSRYSVETNPGSPPSSYRKRHWTVLSIEIVACRSYGDCRCWWVRAQANGAKQVQLTLRQKDQ